MKRLFKLALPASLSMLLLCPAAVSAQESTPIPEPTATPAWQQAVTLTSGSTMLVDRHITYGDIGIMVLLAALLLVFMIYLFVRVPRLWDH